MRNVAERVFIRRNCRIPVQCIEFTSGGCKTGTIFNFSVDGLYLETPYALTPGTEIEVKVEKDVVHAGSLINDHHYPLRVVWCKRLNYNGMIGFGVGVKLIQCDMMNKDDRKPFVHAWFCGLK